MHSPADTHGGVRAAADDLLAALARAGPLLTRPDIVATNGRSPGPAGSSPPWNSAVADALLDAHAGVRDAEADARYAVYGKAGPARGGSDANTTAAVESLVAMAEALSPPAARRIGLLLARWATAVLRLVAIDEAQRWLPIRVQSGKPWPCPYCGTYSLRVAERSGVVMCFYPGDDGAGCGDSDGRKPSGRLDLSRLNGDVVLVWDDGLTQGADNDGARQ